MRSIEIAGVLLAAIGFANVAFAAEDDPVAVKDGIQIIKDCDDCPEMVVIPPGQFRMGTPGGSEEGDADTGEFLQLNVTIKQPFALAKTEVTRAQFQEFVRATGLKPDNGCRVWKDGWIDDRGANWSSPRQPPSPKDNHAVNCVNWNDAQAYVAWLSQKTGKTYRLPSESEWEYAVRAGSPAPRFYGMNSFEGVSISLACEYANVFDVSGRKDYPFPYPFARCKDNYEDVALSGAFKPNAFGLHDMIGNVWEWVGDCYTGSYWGRPPDGSAWTWQGGCEQRGLRGGAWSSRPADARSAKRNSAVADYRASDVGFRVARDLADGEAN